MMDKEQLEQAQLIIDYMTQRQQNTYNWMDMARALNIQKPTVNILLDDLTIDEWVKRPNESTIRLIRKGNYIEWKTKRTIAERQKEELELMPKTPLRHWTEKNKLLFGLMCTILGVILGYAAQYLYNKYFT